VRACRTGYRRRNFKVVDSKTEYSRLNWRAACIDYLTTPKISATKIFAPAGIEIQ
jgi:hypothetical protein